MRTLEGLNLLKAIICCSCCGRTLFQHSMPFVSVGTGGHAVRLMFHLIISTRSRNLTQNSSNNMPMRHVLTHPCTPGSASAQQSAWSAPGLPYPPLANSSDHGQYLHEHAASVTDLHAQ